MRSSIIFCLAVGLAGLDGVVGSRCRHRSESTTASSTTSSGLSTTTLVTSSSTAETSSASITTASSITTSTVVTTTPTSSSTSEVPTPTNYVFGNLPINFIIRATAGVLEGQRLNAPVDEPVTPAFFNRRDDNPTSLTLETTGRLKAARSPHVLCVAYGSDPRAELANVVACPASPDPALKGMEYLDCNDHDAILTCSAPACWMSQDIFEVAKHCKVGGPMLSKFYFRNVDASGNRVLALGMPSISADTGAEVLEYEASGRR